MQNDSYLKHAEAIKVSVTKMLDQWINYIGVATGGFTASFAWLAHINNLVIVVGLVATLLSIYFQWKRHLRQKRRAEQEEILFNLKLKELQPREN